MKNEFIAFPDLEAAFDAVKGLLFGPLDAGVVKHKFNEIVRDAKDKRDLELSPFGTLGLAQQERDRSERKDRDHQTLTLTALLARNAAYREAHEAAMKAFADAGNAIDDAIEAGEKALAAVTGKIEDYLASTPRLKDGRYVMFDPKDGLYKDQDFKAISEEDLAGIDKEAVKEILPYERMMEWKAEVERDVGELRGDAVAVGERKNRALDDKNPTQEDQLKADKEWGEDLREKALEKEDKFGRISAALGGQSVEAAESFVVSSATIAKPQI